MTPTAISGRCVIDPSADFVSDKEVNIYEYANPTLQGVGGAIKCRATDFVVQEIRSDGTRVTFLPEETGRREPNTEPENSTTDGYTKCTMVCVVPEPSLVILLLPSSQHKIMRETQEVFADLSAAMSIPMGSFSCAGLKDKW